MFHVERSRLAHVGRLQHHSFQLTAHGCSTLEPTVFAREKLDQPESAWREPMQRRDCQPKSQESSDELNRATASTRPERRIRAMRKVAPDPCERPGSTRDPSCPVVRLARRRPRTARFDGRGQPDRSGGLPEERRLPATSTPPSPAETRPSARASGIAGEPPPEPRSIRSDSRGKRRRRGEGLQQEPIDRGVGIGERGQVDLARSSGRAGRSRHASRSRRAAGEPPAPAASGAGAKPSREIVDGHAVQRGERARRRAPPRARRRPR